MADFARSNDLSADVKRYAIRKKAPTASEAALLVIDMQEYFRDIASPIIGPLQKIISSCRKAGVPVIFTRHIDDPNEVTILREWWPGGDIIEGTAAASLMSEVGQEKDDKLITKSTYSGFQKTDLGQVLSDLEVKEVLITGVMTNLCCETTARDAFVRGFRVFFSPDATATSDEELHQSTLKNLAYGFAYLIDAEGVEKAFAAC